jgi:hypothetical protein
MKRGGYLPSSGVRSRVETEWLAKRKSSTPASPTNVFPVFCLRVKQRSKPSARISRHNGMGKRKRETILLRAHIGPGTPSLDAGTRPRESA